MAKWSKLRKADWAFAGLTAAVLGLGAYLRLSHLDIVPFHADSARSLLLARWYLENHALPTTSTMASVGILTAPLEMNVNVAALLISSDPAFVTSLYAFANVLALALGFLLVARNFGKAAALIATALFATSFWAIWFSRGIWDLSLAPLFTVLFMSSLYSFAVRKNEKALIWSLFWLGFLVQTHLSTLPYIPLFMVVLLICRRRIRARHLAVGCILFILPLAPYLYWEISHNFYNLKVLAGLRTGGGGGLTLDLNSWRYAVFVMGSGGYNTTFGPPNPRLLTEPGVLVGLRRTYEIVFYLSLAYLIGRLVLDRKGLSSGRLNGHLLLALWFAIPVVSFLSHRWPLYMHYLIPLFPAQFAIVGLAFADVWRHSPRLLGQALPSIHSRWKRSLAYMPAVVLLSFFGALTAGQSYVYVRFNRWIGEETVTPNYGVPLKHMRRAVEEARSYSVAKGGVPIYVGISNKTPILDELRWALPYFSTETSPLLFFDEGRALVLSPGSHPTIYLLTSNDSPAADLLNQLFPTSKVQQVDYPGGADAFSIYALPPDADKVFRQAQGKAKALPLQWPNGVELLAYTMDETPEAGRDLNLTLYWKIAERPSFPKSKQDYRFISHPIPERDFRLFTHLIDSNFGKAADDDALELPAAYWKPGDLVITKRAMPISSGTQAGPYWLSIGMYEMGVPRPVQLTDLRSGETAQEIRLGPIKVGGRALAPANATDFTFSDTIHLSGFDVRPPVPMHGQPLRVSLYWRTMKNVTIDYKVFVHVLDGDGTLIAQHDGEPLNGLYPFPQWERGEQIRDDHNITVPAEAAGPKLRVIAGIYDPATAQRLRLPDGRDSVDLGEFRLR